jgi:hypothetical protein
MIRRPIQVMLAAAALGVAAASLAGAGPAAGARALPPASGAASALPASLTDLVCHHALAPANRSTSDTAVVRPVAGTVKVGVEFRLIRKSTTTGAITTLKLGGWLTKKLSQTSDVWRVIHKVSDLAAPDNYRFAVSFHWIGAKGKLLAKVVRLSRRCHQPELRPDLEVVSIGVQADSSNPGEDDYAVALRNAGATSAKNFYVRFSDQGKVSNRWVARLYPHQTRSLTFTGPLCSSTNPPQVTADPLHLVDVYSRSQATLTATCPAAAGA